MKPVFLKLRRQFLCVILLALPLVLGACQTTGVAPEDRAKIRGTLNAYQQAINNHSFAELEPLLAPGFQIGCVDPALSRMAVRTGIASHAPIQKMRILSLKPTPNGLEARVAARTTASNGKMRLGFDSVGRIRALEIEPVGKAPAVTVPDVLTSSFIESEGLLYVKGIVNGQSGYLLLDNGASRLLLNPKYFSASAEASNSVTATVNGVRKTSGVVNVRSLNWQGLRVKNLTGELHDFSNQEKPAITPLLGALSAEQFKTCALAVDWEHKIVQVFATRPNGEKKHATSGPPPVAVLPFVYYAHLPSFPILIGHREYSMIFDSGFEGNFLPPGPGLSRHFRPSGHFITSISDGGPSAASHIPLGIIDRLILGHGDISGMPFALHQFSILPARGIFGSPFLQAFHRVEINFRAKTISIWL